MSDQIRAAIRSAPISRYRIAKIIGVSEALLSRFVHGKVGLSQEVSDRIGELLNLRIVAGKPPKIKAPGRGRPRKSRR